MPPEKWEDKIFFTDGSGGKYSAVLELRRCGVCIAVVRFGAGLACEFVWGLCSNLPGSEQTTPRAELYAILLVLFFADDAGPIIIVSDSWLSVVGFRGLQQNGLQNDAEASNADLWEAVCLAMRLRRFDVYLRWAKAHVVTEKKVDSDIAFDEAAVKYPDVLLGFVLGNGFCRPCGGQGR